MLICAGVAVVQLDNRRGGAIAWATPVAWCAFCLSFGAIFLAGMFTFLRAAQIV